MYSQITSNKRKSTILVVLFIGVILLLGYVLGRIYAADATTFLTLSLVISMSMSLTGYFAGDTIALRTAGAQGPIQKNENPYVWRIVENLAIASGLPMPKIYLIPDAAPNAFATGRDPNHASLALTTGLIEQLENEELEGVVAHELSHIKNFDIRLMTLVGVLVGVIVILSDFFTRAHLFRGRNHDNRSSGMLVLLGILLMVLSPIFAYLIQFAVSRKREYLADASGALLTRYPAGLAQALEKIARARQPMLRASNATAHLYISNPFGAKAARGLAHLFSTHPPLEDRIRALRKMIL